MLFFHKNKVPGRKRIREREKARKRYLSFIVLLPKWP